MKRKSPKVLGKYQNAVNRLLLLKKYLLVLSLFSSTINLSQLQQNLHLKIIYATDTRQAEKKLSNMPHMAQCAWCTVKSNLEWHHAIQYSGKQINEWYAIIALCRQCHRVNLARYGLKLKTFVSCWQLPWRSRYCKELPKAGLAVGEAVPEHKVKLIYER